MNNTVEGINSRISEAEEQAEEPKIKLTTSAGLQKKQENSRKTSTSASLTMLKSLCVSQQSVENS